MWPELILGASLLVGCDSGFRACGEAGCGGNGFTLLEFVDDQNQPTGTRGEYRVTRTRGGEIQGPVPFACSAGAPGARDAGPSSDNCRGAQVELAGDLEPGAVVEARFDLAQGGQTEWLALQLDFTQHTDPEFNGPGCPCSWFEAQARPFVVPAGARRLGAGGG
jgi:hypothetical protein